MKPFVLATILAATFFQVSASETVPVNTINATLSKDDITAILDSKTKQHIEISTYEINALITPFEFDLASMTRKDRKTRLRDLSARISADD